MYHRLRKAFATGSPPNFITAAMLASLSSLVLGTTWIIAPCTAKIEVETGICEAKAQQLDPELRDDFLADPLEEEPRDLILPRLRVNRPYSPLELQAIERRLDRLNQIASEQLSQGETDTAFELWQRELKLRRVLGTQAEFTAIQRVAALAWEQQRAIEVRLLTLRTREIWEAVKMSLGEPPAEGFGSGEPSDPADSLISGAATVDIETLAALAQTFETLRDIDSTVEVYQQVIELSAGRNEEQTLQQESLAELHLEWFQFADAADVYLTLLSKARSSGDSATEIAYLEQLVYSYEQADALLEAARAQTDLVALYQGQGEAEKLPGLLVATAQNYRTLDLTDSAIEYYRAAYSAAQRFEQFSFSAQVLTDLGSLYESLDRPDDALGAYTLLVPVEQQAYNDYGMMNAYDSIGQLQRQQGNDREAFIAFQQGLAIADKLNIRQDYFIEQIDSVSGTDSP
ncbi:MAG: tetratricopeptide repeat protein [Cyanobacteria bacterium J06554_3]